MVCPSCERPSGLPSCISTMCQFLPPCRVTPVLTCIDPSALRCCHCSCCRVSSAEEEAADKRKGGKSNAPAGKANGSAGKKKSKKKGKPAKRKPVPAQAAAESDDDEDAHNSNGATNNGASPSHSPGDEDRFHDAQEHLGPASGCTMLPAGKISVQMSEAEVAQMQGLMAEQRAQMKKPARSGKQAAADIGALLSARRLLCTSLVYSVAADARACWSFAGWPFEQFSEIHTVCSPVLSRIAAL